MLGTTGLGRLHLSVHEVHDTVYVPRIRSLRLLCYLYRSPIGIRETLDAAIDFSLKSRILVEVSIFRFSRGTISYPTCFGARLLMGRFALQGGAVP